MEFEYFSKFLPFENFGYTVLLKYSRIGTVILGPAESAMLWDY